MTGDKLPPCEICQHDCDEFSFCYAEYDGKAYRIPYPTAPIPKELR